MVLVDLVNLMALVVQVDLVSLMALVGPGGPYGPSVPHGLTPNDPPLFVFCIYPCVLCGSVCSLFLYGPSKATLRCYTSICDGIISVVSKDL